MTDSQLIKSFVDEYQLEVNGVKFWTPYWRDEIPSIDNPKPVRGMLNGKGTPQQIKTHLNELLDESSAEINDPEEYRSFMIQNQLGVDCSGFIFYVLDKYLSAKRLKLADYLYKPREALLADFENPVYTHPEHVTRELLESQPEQVPLSKIQEFWGNQPIRLAGVRILTSTAANVVINSAHEIQVGDQIFMEGITGIPHHVIVIEKTDEKIVYAHSGRLESAKPALGGVEYGEVSIVEPSKPANYQEWNKEFFIEHPMRDDCVRRLKVLADA